MAMQVQVQELMAQGRVNRYPRHTFQIRHRPWVIQPFLIAPVLPNETMKTAFLQATAITDPVQSNLIGWHLEHYLFYVKHRDLQRSAGSVRVADDLQALMLDPAHTLNAALGWTQAARASLYLPSGSGEGNAIPFAPMVHIIRQITEEYFREEGEGWDYATIDNNPVASIDRGRTGRTWLDSVTDATDMPEGDDIGGEDGTSVSEANRLRMMWEQLMHAQLINMSYEDYLRSFGVREQHIETLGKPELIREVRSWQEPVYTVTPGTGAVTSSIKWSVNERADKNRFFPEPGWIVGFSVARPKVYLSTQTQSAANLMDTALSWIPATFKDEVWSTLKRITHTNNPLPGIADGADGWWVDIRDLLLYGDQFVVEGTPKNVVTLPDAGFSNKRYADLTDAKNIFVDTSNGGYVHQDGLCSFVIAGTQKDWT